VTQLDWCCGHRRSRHGQGERARCVAFSVYFPVLIVLALAVLSLLSLPTHLASYQEQGILRRMSTTPVPPAWMLAAQVIVNLALAVIALGILVVAGTAAFGLGAPRQPGGFTQRTLSQALGSRYQLTATSDSTLKVRRMPLITAKVNVQWNGGRRTLRAAPGEVWILQGINALTIYPKLRRALSRAFAPGNRTDKGPADS
jgi:hypothetical protein